MRRLTDNISQVVLVVALIATIYFFYYNTTTNLTERGIASGFGFLRDQTGFDIILHLIPYSPTSTYFRAFLVGVVNTIFLSFLAIICSTVLGTIVGVARISKNWLVNKLAMCFVEIFRNIPLLLQVFFCYYMLLHYLPAPWDNEIFNVRGLHIGNITVIPELIAMLAALTIYSASYIAENIRSGLQSVDRGQKEAAKALGLPKFLTLRLIIFPQAMRVIIPPLTNQYLNITKNSSLSSAIGFPDLVSVFAGTALNQTGQAVETIFMTMSVYLFISICISIFMNWYNRRTALVSK